MDTSYWRLSEAIKKNRDNLQPSKSSWKGRGLRGKGLVGRGRKRGGVGGKGREGEGWSVGRGRTGRVNLRGVVHLARLSPADDRRG